MDAFEDMDSDDQIMKPAESLEGSPGGRASNIPYEEKKTRTAVLTHRATMMNSKHSQLDDQQHKSFDGRDYDY